MTFTPYSIVLVMLLVFLLIKYGVSKKTFIVLFALCCFTQLNVNTGVFLSIGSISTGYLTFFGITLSLLGFFIIKTSKKTPKLYPLIICLVSFLFSLTLMVLYPFKETVLLSSWDDYVYGISSKVSYYWLQNGIPLASSLTLVCFPFIIYIFANFLSQKEKQLTIHLTISICLIASCFGIAEFLEQNILSTNFIYKIVCYFFGYTGKAVHNHMYQKMGFYVVNGLTTEASYHAFSCIILLFIQFIQAKSNSPYFHCTHIKNTYFLMALTFLSGLFTFSLTFFSLIFFASFWFLFIYFGNISKKRFLLLKIVFLLIVMISFIFACSPASDLLDFSSNELTMRIGRFLYSWKSIQNGITPATIGSEYVRLLSIHDTFFDVFLKRPLFGIGIPTTYCHSTTLNELISVGLIGAIFWTFFIFKQLIFLKRDFWVIFANFAFFAFVLPFFVSGFSIFKSLPLFLLIFSSTLCIETTKNKTFFSINTQLSYINLYIPKNRSKKSHC